MKSIRHRIWPKPALTIACILCSALFLSGCGNENPGTSTQQTPAPQTVTYSVDFARNTKAIDDYKSTPASEQGTVVSLDYSAPAYVVNAVYGEDLMVDKTLNVYLPFGYDDSQQYNILYLLHGGGEDQDYWFGDRFGEMTVNVLDNMIQDGLCEPLIVVTPTFYSMVDGYEINEETAADELKNWSDSNVAGSPSTLWNVHFQYELRNDIIPLVESQYAGYSKGDVSEQALIAARDHRAFAGFSMGSMTSMISAMVGCGDLFSYIGSFSGALTDFETIQEAFTTGMMADYEIKYWFNGNGKADMALDEHQVLIERVQEEMSDHFVIDENLAWVVLPDGSHSYGAWIVHLYDSLLVFFK